MSDIVFGKTAQEFFREAVSDALAHRRIRIQQETEFYLVNLLAGHLAPERRLGGSGGDPVVDREPLALILKRALEGGREERWRNLKRLGDTSLFVSGFFGDSLARSLVDVDYYIAMGERAYDALSDVPPAPGMEPLFAELAERFASFVDLFAEIAEMSDLRSNRGLVRLYERFLQTGSQRVAERLRERGVALFAGPATPREPLKH